MINYLKNWNIIRILRLVMGIFIIIQGVMYNQWIFVILGGLFSLLPLLNAGCGASGCSVPKQRNKKL
ncbi:hypothetical protein [Flavobacterium sp.]|uniref:hypothetical protein n=1 Tax=Flavobacterium sp. TaxID=239 RepID=UPI0026206B60|nr:hypothetical protein [Flavobacterium sp.]MDD3005564.1 hypothetical protein [Flavobacterium sp.]